MVTSTSASITWGYTIGSSEITISVRAEPPLAWAPYELAPATHFSSLVAACPRMVPAKTTPWPPNPLILTCLDSPMDELPRDDLVLQGLSTQAFDLFHGNARLH